MSFALVDRKGDEFAVGQAVWYNLGGAVARGTISAIKPGKEHPSIEWRWLEAPVIFIEPDSHWKSIASKRGYSTVKVSARRRYRDLYRAVVVPTYVVESVVVESNVPSFRVIDEEKA